MDAVVRLYGKRESPQAYALRDYLQRCDIPFEWVELRDNEQARAELRLDSVDDPRLPICIRLPPGERRHDGPLTSEQVRISQSSRSSRFRSSGATTFRKCLIRSMSDPGSRWTVVE